MVPRSHFRIPRAVHWASRLVVTALIALQAGCLARSACKEELGDLFRARMSMWQAELANQTLRANQAALERAAREAQLQELAVAAWYGQDLEGLLAVNGELNASLTRAEQALAQHAGEQEAAASEPFLSAKEQLEKLRQDRAGIEERAKSHRPFRGAALEQPAPLDRRTWVRSLPIDTSDPWQ